MVTTPRQRRVVTFMMWRPFYPPVHPMYNPSFLPTWWTRLPAPAVLLLLLLLPLSPLVPFINSINIVPTVSCVGLVCRTLIPKRVAIIPHWTFRHVPCRPISCRPPCKRPCGKIPIPLPVNVANTKHATPPPPRRRVRHPSYPRNRPRNQ